MIGSNPDIGAPMRRPRVRQRLRDETATFHAMARWLAEDETHD